MGRAGLRGRAGLQEQGSVGSHRGGPRGERRRERGRSESIGVR